MGFIMRLLMRIRTSNGFTLIELLIVVVIIGIIAGAAVPGLLRARQSGNEASAIGSVRAIHSAQTTFAASCGGGGFAGSLAALATAPPAGQPFVSPDLATANVAPGKAGYLVNTAAVGNQVLPAVVTCNMVANSFADYLVTATPLTVGFTGQRSFGSNSLNTIYQDSTGAILTVPLTVGGTVSILQ
jgi:type IV pilus assembly protein PilA